MMTSLPRFVIERPESLITSNTTRASSPVGIPEIREAPFDNIAHTKARLATLFEPGTDTTASIGPSGGRRWTVVTTVAGLPDGIREPATRLETLLHVQLAQL
jgi:hypothetical protein